MERTLLKTEQVLGREEVAERLQQFVEKLQSGETINLQGGENELSLDVPEQVEFEVKVEEESSGDMSLELELEWGGASTETSDTLEIS